MEKNNDLGKAIMDFEVSVLDYITNEWKKLDVLRGSTKEFFEYESKAAKQAAKILNIDIFDNLKKLEEITEDYNNLNDDIEDSHHATDSNNGSTETSFKITTEKTLKATPISNNISGTPKNNNTNISDNYVKFIPNTERKLTNEIKQPKIGRAHV